MPGYQCVTCDGAEHAVVLITPLSGAETLAVGENCLPVVWCGMFAGVTGIDAELLWNAAVAIKEMSVADEDPATGDMVEGLVPPLDTPKGGPAVGIGQVQVGDGEGKPKRVPRVPAAPRRPRAAKQ